MGKKLGAQLKGFVKKATQDIARETSKGAEQFSRFVDKAETQVNDGTFGKFLDKARKDIERVAQNAVDQEDKAAGNEPAIVEQMITPQDVQVSVTPDAEVQQPVASQEEWVVVTGDGTV